MPALTVKAIEGKKPKDRPYKFTIDRGLQMRVAPDGARTLLVRYTVNSSSVERQYRLPREYGEGPGKIKLADARAEAARIRALARDGIDWPEAEAKRLKAEEAKRHAIVTAQEQTFADALREYIARKRRAKDGLALKARTKADYVSLIAPGRLTRNGHRFADGALAPLAAKPLSQITATDIRDIYEHEVKRSLRCANYAMQLLRAVIRWHGIVIADNPLGRDTAGRNRIILAPATGNPSPIPPEKLGAWWRAACEAPSKIAGDYYRFQLLTGCRGGEIHGEKKFDYPPLRVGDVDLVTGKITLRDTKNRTDHKLLLSRQALAIAATNCKGRDPDAALFPIVDPRKTLKAINAAAETRVQGHGIRATFASVAEPPVSGGVLKRMLNHATGGDITLGHYVAKSEAQLRAGWQTVADFIEAEAQRFAAQSNAPLGDAMAVAASYAEPGNGARTADQLDHESQRFARVPAA